MDVHELDAPSVDEPTAEAFRRALTSDVDGQSLLAGVRRRARRRQRARVARIGSLAVAAMTALLVLPSLDLHRSTTFTQNGDRGPSALSPTQGNAPTVTTAVGLATLDEGNLLRLGDVTAFPGRRLTSTAEELPSSDVAVGGACTDEALPVATPSSGVRVDVTEQPDTEHTGGIVSAVGHAPVGLVETVWQWSAYSNSPQQVLDTLRSQVPGCASHRSEGNGAPTLVDASEVSPAGGSALALVSTGGSGLEVQVVMIEGGRLVRVQATGFAGESPQQAVADLTPTLRVAAQRAFGSGASQ